jgi:replicative DNA helicase
LLNKAESGAKWQAKKLLNSSALNNNKERDITIGDTLELIDGYDNPIDQQDILDELSAKVGIPAEVLKAERDNYLKQKSERDRHKAIADSADKIRELSINGDTERLIKLLNNDLNLLNKKQAVSITPYCLDDLLQEIKETPNGLKTGISSLDERLLIPNGAITIIAARPSHGKTTFLINLLVNMVSEYKGKTFVFFSYEEAKKQIATKVIINLSGISLRGINNLEAYQNYFRLRDTDPNPGIERGLDGFREFTKNNRMLIIDDPLKIDDLVRQITELQTQYPLGGVFIDYIQKIKPSERSATRQADIQDISAKLLEVANRFSLPVIVAAQLNRYATSAPSLDQLREAGDLEQDANLVLSLFNESVSQCQNNKTVPSKKAQEIKVKTLKNRYGPLDIDISLNFGGSLFLINDNGIETGL